MKILESMRESGGRLRKDTRGSFGILFALSLVPLLLLVGAAVDMAAFVQARADLQSAMDSAVLAAVSQGGALRSTTAAAFLTANVPKGVVLGAATWTTNADSSFTGQVRGTLQTSFFGIANIPALRLSASSTATPASGSSVCILVKNPLASQSLLANTGAIITAPGCEIDVASTAAPAAAFEPLSVLAVAKTCVQGASISNIGGVIANLSTSCQTATDPFAGTLPAVSLGACTVSNQTGVVALSPGTYCGSFSFIGVGTLMLAPGLYKFSGAKWTMSTGWIITGSGVTFYFADSNSSIQVNGGAAINVSAPTAGTYANILMYEPTGLAASAFSIDGTAGHLLSGLIYLPSRDITFNAMANVTADPLTLVADRLVLGTMAWVIAPGAKPIASASGGGAVSYLAPPP